MSPLGRLYLCLCLRADKFPKIKAKVKQRGSWLPKFDRLYTALCLFDFCLSVCVEPIRNVSYIWCCIVLPTVYQQSVHRLKIWIYPLSALLTGEQEFANIFEEQLEDQLQQSLPAQSALQIMQQEPDDPSNPHTKAPLRKVAEVSKGSRPVAEPLQSTLTSTRDDAETLAGLWHVVGRSISKNSLRCVGQFWMNNYVVSKLLNSSSNAGRFVMCNWSWMLEVQYMISRWVKYNYNYYVDADGLEEENNWCFEC